LAQQRLELGEGLLDRVHVGRVGRQQKELCTLSLYGGAHGGNLVGRQVVQGNDVAGLEGGDQHLLDIGEEGLASHRSIEHHRRAEPVLA